MLFNSYVFLFCFLPIVLFSNLFLQHTLARIYLFVGSSLFFLAYWRPLDLVVLLFLLLITYVASLVIDKSFGWRRNGAFAIAVALSLTPLIYFKYSDFLFDLYHQNLKSSVYINPDLPLGISFYTFQSLGYVFLVYGKKIKPPNFWDYTGFIALFPQLIAGPIADARRLLPQLASVRKFRKGLKVMFAAGLTYFAIGFFKKVVIADKLGATTDQVFLLLEQGYVVSFFDAICGAISYSFQLYFDFSGYCDMAIGLGLMIGIKLPLNFYSPLKSVNLIEFWRRWHITLGRFIKDFFYVPLSIYLFRPLEVLGRKGESFVPIVQVAPLIFTFVLLGVWHGAGLTFLLFGAFHATGIVLCRLWGQYVGIKMPRMFAWLINFLFVVFGFVIFRSQNLLSVETIILSIVGPDVMHSTQIFDFMRVLILILSGMVIFALPAAVQLMPRYCDLSFLSHDEGIHGSFIRWRPNVFWAIFTGLLLFFALLALGGPQVFLYFQF